VGAASTGPNTNRNLAQRCCVMHEGKESMYRHSTRLLLAGMLLFTPGLTSCVSQRLHQQAMEEKDAEIRTLREERSALKIQNQQLKTNYESMHGQLSDASAAPEKELVVAPPPAPAPAAAHAKIPELDEAGISYGMRDGNMVITVPSSITFASGQATLSKEGQGALKKVAGLLKKEYGNSHYSIEGHTDDEPIKKSKFETNRELSYARAMAVLAYLVSDCGIKDDDCVVVAHGQYEPLVAKGDKAKNRRVEIIVHKH